ncbi:MAG: hypothetical protein QOJ09_1125, partial [Actinomycetota bacterium]|nr:hypothetical protein [Actinomycetota bacterium]
LTPPAAIGDLSAARPVLTFHGAVGNSTPIPLVSSPVPVLCEATCKEFTFGNDASAPFLVSVRDTQHSTNDGFDLFVYDPAGNLVDAANGIGADGQAVAVKEPKAGTYTVVVAFTYEYQPDAAYDGEVRRMAAGSWGPAPPTCGITVSDVTGCFILPALAAVPASDLHVDGVPPAASTPVGFPLPVVAPTPNSCYLDESLGITSPKVGGAQNPVTRCLRFTTDVRNVGAGDFKVQIPWLVAEGTSPPVSGFAPGGCNATQLVPTTDGKVVTRPAGPCLFHAIHAHFHYGDLVSFALYKVTPEGRTGEQVGTSNKESFCLADDEYFGFGTAGPNGPRNYVGQPGCNLPASAPPKVTVEMGVTPGWGDVYTWDTPGQFVDISAAPDGVYDVIEMTNPTGHILVSGPQQTCSRTRLSLTADAVKVLSTADVIACPGAAVARPSTDDSSVLAARTLAATGGRAWLGLALVLLAAGLVGRRALVSWR